jgi:hypothetical protein
MPSPPTACQRQEKSPADVLKGTETTSGPDRALETPEVMKAEKLRIKLKAWFGKFILERETYIRTRRN